MSWLSRLANVFRSTHLDRDLDDELQFHIETRTEDLIATGLAPAEARRQARLQFGNRLLLRESSRDAKLFPWLESIFQDARFGLRMLLKNRVVTAAAILSLSLAIGASTAAFSLIDALLLRTLPVNNPQQLVALTYPDPFGHAFEGTHFNYPQYERFRELSANQAEVFGIFYGGNLNQVVFDDSGNQEENVRTERISGNGFSVLGVPPVLVRFISANDDGRAGHRVAVLSYTFWMRRF